MNLLFFVGTLNAGGAERVATTLARAWVERGYRVTLVVTHLESEQSFYPLHPDIRVVWLGLFTGWMGTRRYVSTLAKWWAIRRLIKRLQPDVVLSFLTNVNVNVLMAAWGLDVPIMVAERTHPVHSTAAGRVLRRLRRHLYPRARQVLVQTEGSVAAMRAEVPRLRDVAAIPNPLPADLNVWTPPAREAGAVASHRPHQALRIVAMGRLVASKQFDQLIDAFAAVAVHHPGWELVIWGEGPQRGTLERQIAALGMEARIQLPGNTRQPWQELSRGHIFAMTSRVEGFPNVLLEAMALGLAAVVADCPSGPAEITGHGKLARLIPVNDQPALQAALRELMSDSALRQRLGSEAACSVARRYALETVLQQWDTVLRRVTRPSLRS